MAKKKTVKTVVRYLLLVVVLIAFMFPIYWMLMTSFKPREEVMVYPPIFVSTRPTLDAYFDAIRARGGLVIQNSIMVAIATTVITTVLAAFSGYSLARFKTGGMNLAFWILSTRMLPPVAVIIPLFLMWYTLGLVDTIPGLVLAHFVLTVPFAVWLMRGFYLDIPKELEESAMVDGCSRFSALLRVVLPVAVPGIAVTALFSFVFSWNEFLFAIVLTREAATTMPVLVAGMHEAHGVIWSQMAGLSALGMAPIIVLTVLAQRYLVRGLTLGAVRG